MAGPGAPIGNKNGAKVNRIFGDELRKVVAQDRAKLRQAAEELLKKAADGDLASIKELRDSLDGRPAQAIVGADGESLKFRLEAPWLKSVAKNRGWASTDTDPEGHS